MVDKERISLIDVYLFIFPLISFVCEVSDQKLVQKRTVAAAQRASDSEAFGNRILIIGPKFITVRGGILDCAISFYISYAIFFSFLGL